MYVRARMHRPLRSLTIALPLLATLASCAPSLPSDPHMPSQPKAAAVTDRHSVTVVSGPTVPFIVDWKPEDRADLEEAITDGVAVVAYDEQGFRLLKRCRLKGDYGYLPLEPKRDVIRFASESELRANLPVGGAGLAATLGGELEHGKTLDLAYVMIGKRRTTWSDPTRDDLEGKCEGATHYVRAMTIGAFAMSTGTRDKLRAAAEIFAASAGGGISTSGSVTSTDGDLNACQGANADVPKPPPGCRSLLRLELEPIVASTDETKRADQADGSGGRVEGRKAVDCGEGMVFADGKCTVATEDLPRFCSPWDLADCELQCRKGDAASCDQAGYLVVSGAAGPVDEVRADAFFEKACAGGSTNGCVNLGWRQVYDRKSPSGIPLLEKACREGDARGCSALGDIVFNGFAGVRRDVRAAAHFYTLGCNGGDGSACTNLGVLYMGAGAPEIPIDEPLSLDLSVRGCFGGISTACGNTGLRFEFGMGVPRDLEVAESLFKRACQLFDADCLRLGILYQHGSGVPRDDRRAKALFEKSCNAIDEPSATGFPSLACYVNAKVYGAPLRQLDVEALERTLDVMAPQCSQDIARACTFYGVSASALGRSDAASNLKRGCSLGDPWACDLIKRMK